jgi:hypothetical protein
LATVVVGVVVGLIFHSWVIPVAVVGGVALLMVLNRIRPQNYTLIARNVTNAHEFLKKNFSGKLDSEDLLLAFTGIVAASPYLAKNQLSLADIVKAVEYAKKKQIFLLGRHIDIYDFNYLSRDPSSYDLMMKNDLLLDFTLNVAALELAVDAMNPQMTPMDVLGAVSNMKSGTYKAIEETRKKGRVSPGIADMSNRVMASVDVNAIREALQGGERSNA